MESWVYHYDAEQRQQTAEWTKPDCSALKQAKGSKLFNKPMVSVFRHAKEILLIDSNR